MNEHKHEKVIKMKHNGDDMPDPKVIGELLDVVAARVPKLLADISDVLYGEGRAKQYAISVATFYKELKEAGMSDDEAFSLTQQYMSALNVGKTIGHATQDANIEIEKED